MIPYTQAEDAILAQATTQAQVDRNLVYARAGYEAILPQRHGDRVVHRVEDTGFGIAALAEAARLCAIYGAGVIVRLTPSPIDPTTRYRTIVATYRQQTGFWLHLGARTPLETATLEAAQLEALEQGLLPIEAMLMDETLLAPALGAADDAVAAQTATRSHC